MFMKQQLLQFHLGFFGVQWDPSEIGQEMPKLQLFSAEELWVGKQQWDCYTPPTSCLSSPFLSGKIPAAQKHNSKPLIHCCSQTVLKCPSYDLLGKEWGR